MEHFFIIFFAVLFDTFEDSCSLQLALIHTNQTQWDNLSSLAFLFFFFFLTILMVYLWTSSAFIFLFKNVW